MFVILLYTLHKLIRRKLVKSRYYTDPSSESNTKLITHLMVERHVLI